MLSAIFAQQLKKETGILGYNSTPECTIPITLKWSGAIPSTVKDFEVVIKSLFIDYSQYIHIQKVDKCCVFVTLCTSKLLMVAPSS